MEKLKFKRTSRRAQNTRIINEASAAMADPGATTDQLASLYERLKTNNDELNKINEELEAHIQDQGAFEAEYASVIEYQDNATRVLAELRSKSNRLSQAAAPMTGPVTNVTAPVAATTLERTGPSLPKLTITPFYGDLCRWNEFWEQFDQMINKNSGLSVVEKFHYLRLFLKGDAAPAIRGLPTTEACYQDALAILKKRFADGTRLEQEYFARLRMINPIRSSSDTSSLRKLNDQVLINIRGLETLNVKRSSFSSMLSDILLRALPHIVLQYHRTRAAETPTPQADAPKDVPTDLDCLLKFLSTELENLEKSDFRGQRGQDTRTEYETDKSVRLRDSKPTSCVLSSTSATSSEGCAFCKSESHITESCPADIPLENKKQILSKKMRCFRCTLKGHRARDCRRKITCNACAGRHASSVCSPRKNNARDSRSEGSPNPRTTVCASDGKKSGLHTSGCILLQTFRAWAVSDNACRYVRGVFDGGSQRAFVTKELCEHLKLKSIRFIDIALNTFANAKSHPVTRRRIVELRLKSQFSDTEVVLSAIEIPNICQESDGSTMNSSFVGACKASGKDIADELLHPDVITRGGISILIGSDQMWTIMSGELVRSHKNQTMIAINTKLGWTFQGRSTEVTATANNSPMMV